MYGRTDVAASASVHPPHGLGSRLQTVPPAGTAGMKRLRRERADREMRNIEAVLTELAAAIEKELAEPAYAYRQLELWSPAERHTPPSHMEREVAGLMGTRASHRGGGDDPVENGEVTFIEALFIGGRKCK